MPKRKPQLTFHLSEEMDVEVKFGATPTSKSLYDLSELLDLAAAKLYREELSNKESS